MLNVLYGSVTRTAENLAIEAARVAKARGYQVELSELDDVSMDDLEDMEDVLVFVSTYGEGEMPFNAELFWDEIETDPPELDGVNFGVLALGDTAYKMFCQAGKDIDERLEELGANRRMARADCDLAYEEVAKDWIDRALPTKNGSTEADTEVTIHRSGDENEGDGSWSASNPFRAKILEDRLLSGPGSDKEVRHYALDLTGSEIEYAAGDCVAVIPRNPPHLVEAMLERLGASAEDKIEGFEEPLGELLTSKLEITVASKALVRAVSSALENAELNGAVEGGDADALEDYLWGKDVLDILNIDPELQAGADVLVSLLQPLKHRAYSIASSDKAHPDQLHLTVATLRWEEGDHPHQGACSTYMTDGLGQGAEAEIFMVPNRRFRVPEDPNVPMIMIGPGTGIAPFMAFLQERKASGAKGVNWLFFGDRHRAEDFLYEEELSQLQAEGVLSRLDLAFSRDQEEKVYVQDKMREHGAELYAALERGGHVYVCGDAKRMAVDVEKALRDILEEHGGMSPESAFGRIADMRRLGRYCKDVY